MNKKKLYAVIAVFVAYSVALFFISSNYQKSRITQTAAYTEENTGQEKTEDAASQESLNKEVDLLTPDAFTAVNIQGKADADTPWHTNIELLGTDYPEQGLFMMPGSEITYTVQIPTEGRLTAAAKIYDSIAEQKISDGATLVIELIQDGNSLITFDPIVVPGNGQTSSFVQDLTEWQGRTLQMRIRCFDGGNDDAVGDWVVIKKMQIDDGGDFTQH